MTNYHVAYETPYRIIIRRTAEECDDGRQIYGSLLLARAHLAERYDTMIAQLRDQKRTWMRTAEKKLPVEALASAGEKVIEGLKQAIDFAKCEHVWVAEGAGYRCDICHGRMTTIIPASPSEPQGQTADPPAQSSEAGLLPNANEELLLVDDRRPNR